MNNRRKLYQALAVLLFLHGGFVGAAAPAQQTQQTQPASELSGRNDADEVTEARIKELLGRVESSAELDDEAKASLKSIYEKALTELESAKNWNADAKNYQAAIRAATAELARTREQLAQPAKGFDFPAIDESTQLADLVDRRNQWDQTLQQTQAALAAAQAEPNRRSERRSRIPEELSESERAQQEIKRQLALDPADSLSAELIRATQVLNLARLRAVEAAARRLKLESETYDAQGREYLQLRIDLLTARSQQQADDLKRLTDEIAKLRRTDSESQLKLVQSLAEKYPPSAETPSTG